MKVIDLLNKIANNEEVPKKIKCDGYTWVYQKGTHDYLNDEKNFFSVYGFVEHEDAKDFLKKEIKIIEEKPKKIEKLPKHITDNACASKDLREIANKINEIIDYLLEKESDK